MTRQEFDRALRAFVAAGSGLDDAVVIPGNSTGPRPTAEYASLLMIRDLRNGYPIFGAAGQQMTYRRWTGSLQFYRPGAEVRALNFASFAESEPGLTEAERTGIRIVQPFAVQRLDSIVSEIFEERALINLSVDFVFEYSPTTDTIESATADICVTPGEEDSISAGN